MYVYFLYIRTRGGKKTSPTQGEHTLFIFLIREEQVKNKKAKKKEKNNANTQKKNLMMRF